MSLASAVVAPRLEFRNLTVDFGATRALNAITASIQPGEIVGLLGHNGAGKTTLFNVVAGANPATSGTFLLGYEEISQKITPREIASKGVTVLYQDPALTGNLSVLDNLYLAQLAPFSRPDRAQAAAALERVGSDLDLDQLVDTLSLGERQLVALARGLLGKDMKVLLLDEPTAALGLKETEALHSLIRKFAKEGVAVVYVSHRLPDILQVCQRIIILSAGEIVADGPVTDYDARKLARALAPGLLEVERSELVLGQALLSVKHAGTPLSFREGEVVGLFGMAGGEQFAILERLFGLKGKYSTVLSGLLLEVSNPLSAMKQGIHLVPADREKDGLISGMSAAENTFLPWYRTIAGRGWWVSRDTGNADYDSARERLNILGPTRASTIDQFSGGNRQKHLIARWMFVKRPKILLLAQPTQGVDVGAKADIVRAVRAMAAQGTIVIVASAESDEIASICDRSYILFHDHVRERTAAKGFDEQLLADLLDLAQPQPHSQPDLLQKN
ncbi:sugar ABC transporter ATP-binding protein [Alpinimonas psychrophila]|uniref:ABC-type sugar transport system ATPase subunit n=1 Tax=Alpinimonas psychrophila TaxID=748908 RepID=A0A7W3PPS6_9MICO|nr:sugar ABC transporter ATP-binding protein [Alpinimonas psychrophila]MBA8829755.1 ABC-type sugar transport system ATPase subunit [Alpinimonas psychrophila]